MLALSPLCYLGGFLLIRKLPAPVTNITINRERAVQIATEVAVRNRVDVRGWNVTSGTNKDKDVSAVLESMHSPALEQLSGAAIVTILFRAPQSHDWYRVQVNPQGRVVSFGGSEPKFEVVPVDHAVAETIASTYLLNSLGPAAPFELKAPRSHLLNKDKQRRMFDWKAKAPDLPDVDASFQVQLFGDKVVAVNSDLNVHSSLLQKLHPARKFSIVLKVIAVIYLVIMGIYAIVRYLRRAREKEVSHWRTFTVAVLFLAVSVFAIYYGAFDANMNVNGEPATGGQRIAIIMMSVVFFFSFAGGFFGIAYGAGEGDVRAYYPGKLTSLDALLTGKLFSKNVARSILAGGAFAGAMLLIQAAGFLAVHAHLPGTYDIVVSLIHPVVLGDAGADVALTTLALSAFGLLLPLALLRPRIKREWLLYTLLAVFAALSSVIWGADTSTRATLLISVAVITLGVVVPFFLGDLLASISSIVALSFTFSLFTHSVVADAWAQLFSWIIYPAVVFLLVEIYFAERGRSYDEWEVRPLYARRLAEHLSWQAEIGAARQAQLRLLPDTPPPIVGLSIAGSCVPAREVGGDFYDFYPLDDHRVAVFIAEGGNRELASAMPIALAKGYLLYTAQLNLSPVEVLRRLRELLGITLHGEGANISMLYAVIDSSENSLRYARTGRSPLLSINGRHTTEEVASAPTNTVPIHHGGANLQTGDSIVFYTDGLATQLAEERRETVDRFLAKTSAARDNTAAALHSAILKAALRRKNESPVDDVTAVVIRLEEPDTRALEGVA